MNIFLKYGLFVFLLLCSCKSNIFYPIYQTRVTGTTNHPDYSIESPTIIPSETIPFSYTRKPTFTETIDLSIDISYYYGKWIISYYKHYADTYYLKKDDADKQIGNKMILKESEFIIDDNFIWLHQTDCKKASYRRADYTEFVGHGWQILLPWNSPDRREGELLFFDLYCSGEFIIGFEVSKTNIPVFNYADYWFFLERIE
jgi:hypothetical protein